MDGGSHPSIVSNVTGATSAIAIVSPPKIFGYETRQTL
jgi:hypothetical protein